MRLPTQPASSAKAFAKITYPDIYPGIDLEFIIPDSGIGLKYNYLVHPGGDPSLIKKNGWVMFPSI
ncbi:MAG TPA: hypothetical protein VD905_22110 [Flavobacteriales bacterium]|nr:hypothetical protein [Flavobacteriales bacterium]